MGIGGFTLTKHRRVGDEEKTIPSCLDTSSPMIAPPDLPQNTFCALKKTDWPKLDEVDSNTFQDVYCLQENESTN
jgi:hypothetical protein